ncbi:hypothetical protein [Mycobacterium sp. E2733]|uniref:hypothetical protein n=1 Tax=Mycobacterium sp. E2733 TaxID=1834138 RepID=UPI0007FBA653|nr:hypothetical protein [Mycobacterium sp. E2733]OBH88270.1 hypothetical protein A5678_17220 [Mycobacterium sp. E2733]
MDYHKVDPVDHQRTARQHAGETVTYGANAPGLAGAAVAVVALIVGLFALATRHFASGLTAVILAAALGAASAVWLVRTHRRVRDAELAWHAANSGEPAPPPTS